MNSLKDVQESKVPLLGMGLQEMEELAVRLGFEPYRGRQLYRQVYLRGQVQPESMGDIPKLLREALSAHVTAGGVTLERVWDGGDGAKKLLFKMGDGCVVEGVLIGSDRPAKVTQCISSQVGCAMGCVFCRTATMGFRRNLTAGEIVGQILAARSALGTEERVSNLVFMGMGEPLANYASLVKSIHILTSPLGFGFSARRITVSTAGLVNRLGSLMEEAPVGLAISLNATTQNLREKLMPGVAKAFPLDTLLRTCRGLSTLKRRLLTFEYVVIPGVNDSKEDAKRLVGLLAGVGAKVNLIPFNPFPGSPFTGAPTVENLESFGALVRRQGYTVSIRQSKGTGVCGACGQLAGSFGDGQ